MGTIQYVFFDIGGVFVDHISGLRKIARELLLREEDVVKLFKQYSDQIDAGNLSWNAFETIFYNSLLPKKHLKQSLVLSFVNNMRKIQETHDFAQELSKKYTIGVLSNMDSDVFRMIKERGLIPDITYRLQAISYEIGFIKPNKGIFDYVVKQIHTSPNHIMFIDDKVENVEGAKMAGWSSLQFDTYNPLQSIMKIQTLI